MAKSKSSRRWLREHFDDHYVRQARQAGYRSRAVFKLQEIQEKDHILRPGLTVVDLGAAPGGWAQLARERVGTNGRVIATDILPMDAIAGVEFVQGDFREQAVLNQLLELLGESRADLVLSDMAPNISGMRSVDQPRAMYLAELALDLARQVLREGGDALIKVFQGEGFDAFYREMQQAFRKVVTRKPKASRPRSREVYLLGRDFKGT
jgi:23S rRNA (uridine2552-2'-O)-methyltransferase